MRSILDIVARKILGRVDVVHINLSQDGSAYRKIVVAWVCRRLNIPYILHLHGSHFHHFWDNAAPSFDRALIRLFSGATRTIVLGTVWTDFIVKKAPAVASRIVILPNATRTPTLNKHKPDRSVNAELNLLFLGEIGKRKGIPELVAALARISEYRGWHAILAGNGEIDATRRQVHKLRLTERIAVPGWIDDRGVEDLLQSADILILPSFDENFPMSVVEGFAHGLAVIATPVGATGDIVRDEETGLLVPPGNVDALTTALRRLLTDPGLRLRLGANARALHAEELEIGMYAQKLVAVWKAAASRTESSFVNRH